MGVITLIASSTKWVRSCAIKCSAFPPSPSGVCKHQGRWSHQSLSQAACRSCARTRLGREAPGPGCTRCPSARRPTLSCFGVWPVVGRMEMRHARQWRHVPWSRCASSLVAVAAAVLTHKRSAIFGLTWPCPSLPRKRWPATAWGPCMWGSSLVQGGWQAASGPMP